MRRFILFATILLSAATLFAQMDCDGYFPFREGTSMEYTKKNKKGKLTGRQEQTITEIHDIDGGLEAIFATKLFDDKDKEAMTGDYLLQCKEEGFYVDMSNMIPPDVVESISEMEAEITGEFMEFPRNPKAGQQLPDGNMQIAALVNGTPMMTITLLVTDRLIEGFESVTTPAGTFECMRYSESTEVKMIFRIRARSVSWYAPGVGVVKTESYDDKGKLQGSTVLTRFNK